MHVQLDYPKQGAQNDFGGVFEKQEIIEKTLMCMYSWITPHRVPRMILEVFLRNKKSWFLRNKIAGGPGGRRPLAGSRGRAPGGGPGGEAPGTPWVFSK